MDRCGLSRFCQVEDISVLDGRQAGETMVSSFRGFGLMIPQVPSIWHPLLNNVQISILLSIFFIVDIHIILHLVRKQGCLSTFGMACPQLLVVRVQGFDLFFEHPKTNV